MVLEAQTLKVEVQEAQTMKHETKILSKKRC